MLKRTVTALLTVFIMVSSLVSVAAQTIPASGNAEIIPNRLTVRWEDGSRDPVTINTFRIFGFNVAQLRTMVHVLDGTVANLPDGSFQIGDTGVSTGHQQITFHERRNVDFIINHTRIRNHLGALVTPVQPGWVFLPQFEYNWASVRDVINALGLTLIDVMDDPAAGHTEVVVRRPPGQERPPSGPPVLPPGRGNWREGWRATGTPMPTTSPTPTPEVSPTPTPEVTPPITPPLTPCDCPDCECDDCDCDGTICDCEVEGECECTGCVCDPCVCVEGECGCHICDACGDDCVCHEVCPCCECQDCPCELPCGCDGCPVDCDCAGDCGTDGCECEPEIDDCCDEYPDCDCDEPPGDCGCDEDCGCDDCECETEPDLCDCAYCDCDVCDCGDDCPCLVCDCPDCTCGEDCPCQLCDCRDCICDDCLCDEECTCLECECRDCICDDCECVRCPCQDDCPCSDCECVDECNCNECICGDICPCVDDGAGPCDDCTCDDCDDCEDCEEDCPCVNGDVDPLPDLIDFIELNLAAFFDGRMTLVELRDVIYGEIQRLSDDPNVDSAIVETLLAMLEDLDDFINAVGQVDEFSDQSFDDISLEDLDALSAAIQAIIDGFYDEDSPFILMLEGMLYEVNAFRAAVVDVELAETEAYTTTGYITYFRRFMEDMPATTTPGAIVTTASGLMLRIENLMAGSISDAEASTSAVADSEILGYLPQELEDMLDDIIDELLVEMVDMLEEMVAEIPVTTESLVREEARDLILRASALFEPGDDRIGVLNDLITQLGLEP